MQKWKNELLNKIYTVDSTVFHVKISRYQDGVNILAPNKGHMEDTFKMGRRSRFTTTKLSRTSTLMLSPMTRIGTTGRKINFGRKKIKISNFCMWVFWNVLYTLLLNLLTCTELYFYLNVKEKRAIEKLLLTCQGKFSFPYSHLLFVFSI